MKKYAFTFIAGLCLVNMTANAGTNPDAVRLTGNNIPAHAEAWTEANAPSLGNTLLSRTVLNFDTPQKTVNGKNVRSIGLGIELDCHAWQYAVISATAGTDIWVNGKAVALYNPPRKMERPGRGSMEESLLNYHCKGH